MAAAERFCSSLSSLRHAPIVAAQVTCLLSIIAIRGWKSVEDGAAGDGDAEL